MASLLIHLSPFPRRLQAAFPRSGRRPVVYGRCIISLENRGRFSGLLQRALAAAAMMHRQCDIMPAWIGTDPYPSSRSSFSTRLIAVVPASPTDFAVSRIPLALRARRPARATGSQRIHSSINLSHFP